jgi:two-component SAPR family response regulator
VLIALGGRAVGETQLSDTLWPDAEGDTAHQDFATTLHRVRKMLGNEKAIVLRDQELSLNPRLCWVDTWAFERLAGEVSAVQTLLDDSAVRAGERALALYSGPFLGTHDAKSWALPARQRLRGKFVRLVKALARHSRDVEDWEGSVALYEKGLDVEPLVEEFYRRLMICYEYLGRRAEALAVYERGREILEATLGAGLSREAESIYERLRSDK